MERLFDLLTQLSIDPGKQQAYAEDPEGVLDQAGLTPEERLVLRHWRRGEDGAAKGVSRHRRGERRGEEQRGRYQCQHGSHRGYSIRGRAGRWRPLNPATGDRSTVA